MMYKKTMTLITVLCLCLFSTAFSTHHKAGEKKGAAEKYYVLDVPGALDFDAETIEGKNFHLSQYLGDVMLVVNVASKCGRTPQYKELQELHEKYKDQGLKVIGFPANDFGKQEPGSNIEIRQFCTANYGVTFDMMSKIHVKGPEKHPFYTFLTSEESNPDFGGEIKWNFEKFLINRNGHIVGHFSSKTKPLSDQIVSTIEAELEKKAIPPGFKVYMGRTIAQTMHYTGADWLLRKKREMEESATQMIEALNLKPGQRVCDLGAGNGYHTLMMATKVGDTGKVLAVDIQKEMLDMLKKRAKGEGIKNIQTILSLPNDPKLPAGKLDLVLLADVYHEFSHPVQMLAAIRKSLKPKGHVVLLEFRTEDKEVPIKPLHKMSKTQIHKEISAIGFKLVKTYDELPWQHMMFFRPVSAKTSKK